MPRLLFTALFCLAAGLGSACPVPPSGLTVQKLYVQPSLHRVQMQGMWAVWYNPAFFSPSEARTVAERLEDTRCVAMDDYGMQWPPNLAAGVRFNVYLHAPGEKDGFEGYAWENGVGSNHAGSNDSGLPFMTLPRGAHADPSNLDHEGFHVFQWAANANDGDSGWFTEASADWFMSERTPDGADNYIAASAIAASPHLAMWHGFYNSEPQDPVHWITENRQYGMHLFLRYLSVIRGLPDVRMTAGFFDGTTLSPQEYLSQTLGAAQFAQAFADFTALMTASYVEGPGVTMPDWLLNPGQRDSGLAERARIMAESPLAEVENDIALTLRIGAGWASPPPALRPRPWSYNVVAIDQPSGSAIVKVEANHAAQMLLRLVVRQGDAWVLAPFEAGQVIDLTHADTAYIVLAWTPPIFGGAATADYRIRIDPVP